MSNSQCSAHHAIRKFSVTIGASALPETPRSQGLIQPQAGRTVWRCVHQLRHLWRTTPRRESMAALLCWGQSNLGLVLQPRSFWSFSWVPCVDLTLPQPRNTALDGSANFSPQWASPHLSTSKILEILPDSLSLTSNSLLLPISLDPSPISSTSLGFSKRQEEYCLQATLALNPGAKNLDQRNYQRPGYFLEQRKRKNIGRTRSKKYLIGMWNWKNKSNHTIPQTVSFQWFAILY